MATKREIQLTTLLLKERLERLTGKKVILKENINSFYITLEVDPSEIEDNDMEGELDPTDIGDKLGDVIDDFKQDATELAKLLNINISFGEEYKEEYPWSISLTAAGSKVTNFIKNLTKNESIGKYTFEMEVDGESILSSSSLEVEEE